MKKNTKYTHCDDEQIYRMRYINDATHDDYDNPWKQQHLAILKIHG